MKCENDQCSQVSKRWLYLVNMLNVIKCQVSYQGHTVAVFNPQSTLVQTTLARLCIWILRMMWAVQVWIRIGLALLLVSLMVCRVYIFNIIMLRNWYNVLLFSFLHFSYCGIMSTFHMVGFCPVGFCPGFIPATRENYPLTFPPPSIDRYSFIQLNDLLIDWIYSAKLHQYMIKKQCRFNMRVVLLRITH